MPDYPVPVPQNAPPPPAPLRLLPRDAPEAEVRAASAVLADAFNGEQIAELISGGVPGLHEARMYKTVATGVLDLEVYTVTDNGEVLGVMVVKPPGFEHRSR
jgi:urease gamma subunit